MSAAVRIQPLSQGQRYEAVLRLSEALSVCREPEDLTNVLSEHLREFLDFLHFFIVIYKKNSSEVEWAVVGQEKSMTSVYAGVPVEQRPSWQAYITQEPFHIRNWETDERVPLRLKQAVSARGLDQGSLVFVPLTTPHRRLGALGMAGSPGTVLTEDDISFLRLIGRVVAFAIDDNFNLRQAEAARGELQRQNERLQDSERELREVIETIPSMAWSAGADGAAEFFNRRWLDYAGLTTEQARGSGWTIALHPDDVNGLLNYFQGILTHRQPGEFEARLRRFDGEYRWFLFRATPSFDDTGKLVKWYGTNTDIEERKRAEQALRRSEAHLAEAQRITGTGSCAIHGTSREILYWSEEMFRLFDFDPRQGLPTWEQWVRRIHPGDRDNFRIAGDKTFLERVTCDVEFRTLLPDETVKYIHGIGYPVLGSDGELVQVVGTMVDITGLKRAEETRNRLHQLEADLSHIGRVSTMGELTASLAHEIRQPMFAASTDATTCLEWLSRDQPNVGAASEAASRVIKDIERASDIINRIKALFKKGTMQRELVDVNDVIDKITMLLQSEADRYRVSMRTALTDDLPKVLADCVQLQQVFMNLMLNGIEAMKETGGALTVESKMTEEGKLLVSIHDTGVGLPTDKVDHIFSAFFTTKHQGTGMGLAITRSIVESHGGRVWATANSKRGASFHFTLPAATEIPNSLATKT